MKHDAIVEQGIPIHERIPIPDELIPEDSRVEIDAKIHSGYFTMGKTMTSTSFRNDSRFVLWMELHDMFRNISSYSAPENRFVILRTLLKDNTE
jgi:hypothetical protein